MASEPNNFEDEDCVYMQSGPAGHRWNDADCGVNHGLTFIQALCEAPFV